MLRFVFSSHFKMADGLKSTLEFLTQTEEKIYAISAYTTPDYDLEKEIKDLFDTFDKDDTVIVMTDVLAGSVNQKFYPYLGEKVHLISGINAPLAMQLVLTPESAITKEYIEESIEMAKNTIVYVNTMQTEDDEDDE